MKLIKLEVKNVFSLGNVQIDLKDRGLTLITGYSEDEGSSNGAGKSSLANKTLLWALWGMTAAGIKADAIINRHGKRKARACVTFEGSDGVEYRIIRERPANLVLEREGKDISAKTAKDTQALIDKALGIDFKTFVQTSFFGQGRSLAYASLPPKDQKSILEQILPMEDVDRWASYADARFKEVSDVVNNMRSGEGLMKVEIRSSEEHLTSLEISAKVADEERERELKSLDARIADPGGLADTARIEILERQLEKIDEEALTAKIAEAQDQLRKISEPKHEADNKRIEAARSIEQWSTRRKYLLNELKTIANSATCPTCLREFDDNTVKAVQERIKTTEGLIAEADQNITLGVNASNFYTKEFQNILSSEQKIHETHKIAHDSLRVMESIRSELGQLKDKAATVLGMLKRQREEVAAKVNSYKKDIERLKEQLKGQKEKLNGLQRKLGVLLGEYEHLEYWKEVFSKELKLKLFEDACPYLDSRVQYHLEQLKNRQIHVEFSTIKRLSSGKVKEDFTVHVWSETGGVGFDSLSGGEQQMTSFAIGLALADLAASTSSHTRSSFLILDEPFSELDARNSEAIVDYLTGELGKDLNTIFLISNEESLKGLISNRIHVVKSKGVSNVSTEV